jgi:REP element-mobilizing transposase RayT
MPSHLHLIARAESCNSLSDILRDFKKFTAKTILNQIVEEPESRREWLLQYFREEAIPDKSSYRFWQEGNHPMEINSNNFFIEKLEYIHNNPVEELIVERPEDYYFSSARNYAGLANPLEIVLESVRRQRI